MVKRLTSLGIFLLAIPLFAHDLYLMPERFVAQPGTTLVVSIHNGDSFPESEVSPVLERIRDLRLISAAGTSEAKNVRVSGKVVRGEVRVPATGSLIVAVRTIPNTLTLGAAEFNAYLKGEGLTHALERRRKNAQSQAPGRERYSKYAKALFISGAEDEFYRQPAGLLIEIVPEASPFHLGSGGKLPIRVLFRGQPASDVQIESAWAGPGGRKSRIVGRTDKDGRILVPLESPGKWRIHTVWMERCADAQAADWESYWASLTFETSE